MHKAIMWMGVYVAILIPLHWFVINVRSIVSGSIGERRWMADSESKIHTLNSKVDGLRIHVNSIEGKIDRLNEKDH